MDKEHQKISDGFILKEEARPQKSDDVTEAFMITGSIRSSVLSRPIHLPVRVSAGLLS